MVHFTVYGPFDNGWEFKRRLDAVPRKGDELSVKLWIKGGPECGLLAYCSVFDVTWHLGSSVDGAYVDGTYAQVYAKLLDDPSAELSHANFRNQK